MRALVVFSLVNVTLSLVGCSTEPEMRKADSRSAGRLRDLAAAPHDDAAAKAAELGSGPAKPTTRRLQKSATVSLDVTDEPLENVLRSVSRSTGINVVVDPGVKETVSISFRKLAWRAALDVLARRTNCVIVAERNRLLRFSQPPPVTLEFHDAELRTVLLLLAEQSGANIVISEEIEGKVTMSFRDVPWPEALEAIAEHSGYVVVYEGKERLSGPVRLTH